MEGVSIIICTYNGSHRISRVLNSLNFKLDIDWEVIIVDNNSSDNLLSVVDEYKNNLPLTLVVENQQGLIYARWKGISISKFSYVLFCDDDNLLNQDYLQNGYNFLASNSKVGVLAGKGEPLFEIKKPDWFDTHKNYYAVGSLGRIQGKQQNGDLVYGAGLFFRIKALIKLKQIGFVNNSTGRKGNNLSGGEDLELALGVMMLGYEYWYDENIVFKHFIESHRLTWEYYLRLSKSIASSYPIIESFKLYRYDSIFSLKLSLYKNQILLIKRIITVGLKGIKYCEKKYESRLKSLQWQFLAFFKNYNKTIHNFEKNKAIFLSESKYEKT